MTDPYAFIFRGQVAQDAVDRLKPRESVLPGGEAEIVRALSMELLDADSFAAARRMSHVYAAIASFENMARDFVKSVLLDAQLEEWWTKGASERIQKKAEGRRQEEEAIRWHAPRGLEPIYYCDFGDLADVIGQNYALFEPFVRSLDWVKNVFNTLERSRNVIMHSGVLETADVQRVGMLIRDWTTQVAS